MSFSIQSRWMQWRKQAQNLLLLLYLWHFEHDKRLDFLREKVILNSIFCDYFHKTFIELSEMKCQIQSDIDFHWETEWLEIKGRILHSFIRCSVLCSLYNMKESKSFAIFMDENANSLVITWCKFNFDRKIAFEDEKLVLYQSFEHLE